MKGFAASNAHMSAAHKLIPGGAHTYAKGDDQYPVGMAPVLERGSGCRVWDLDDNEYIEFGSGLRSNILGHGFGPVVDAVRRWLVELPRRRKTKGHVPDALVACGVTGRECEVFELLAQGASNAAISEKLFISVRTVETHVSSLLSKLGVDGRGQLIAQSVKYFPA